MSPPFKYDLAFRTACTLHGGRRVVLRAPVPRDAPLLVRGFHSLSAESRYRRFLCARQTLSPTELRYLTEIDMTEDGIRRAAFHAMRVAQAHLPVEEAADPCVPAAF